MSSLLANSRRGIHGRFEKGENESLDALVALDDDECARCIGPPASEIDQRVLEAAASLVEQHDL